MNSAYLVTALLDDAFSLSRLPAELRAKSDSLSAARRLQWLAGRALLAEALATLYGGDMLPAMQLSAQGKPSFTDPSLPHFSLSHSKNHLQLVLCAAAETGGDVEQIRPRPPLSCSGEGSIHFGGMSVAGRTARSGYGPLATVVPA